MRLKWLPSFISILRIVLLVPYLLIIYKSGITFGALSLGILIVLSDKLDGALARKLKCESVFGERLDGAADITFMFLTWGIFYWIGIFDARIVTLILLPKLIMAVSTLVYKMRHGAYDTRHFFGGKILSVFNYAGILWILAELPYPSVIIWVVIFTQYFGAALSILKQNKLFFYKPQK